MLSAQARRVSPRLLVLAVAALSSTTASRRSAPFAEDLALPSRCVQGQLCYNNTQLKSHFRIWVCFFLFLYQKVDYISC